MSTLTSKLLTLASFAVSALLVAVLAVLVFRLVATVAIASPSPAASATVQTFSAVEVTGIKPLTTASVSAQNARTPTDALQITKTTEGKALAEPAKDDNTKDAVANAMTAIGTAVAVIALLMAVGTSWFAAKQKELDSQIQIMRTVLQDHQHRLDLVASLSRAKLAVQCWVSTASESDAKILYQLEIIPALELLLADDVNVRRQGFGLLINYPWTGGEPELESVKDFTEACQIFHGRDNPRTAMLRPNQWCRIFWRQEQQRFDIATQPA